MSSYFSSTMLEYPFSVEWSISEEELKALKNSRTKECLKSDSFSAFAFSPIPYHFELYPNGNNDENRGRVWIFLQIPFEAQKNICAQYTFSIETVKWKKWINYIFDGEYDGYGSRICKTHEFFDSTKKFIVDGKFTVRIHGVFKNLNLKSSWAADNFDLWNRGLGDFALKIGGKEILAHQSIFSSQSPVFAAMFKQMNDEPEKKIEIPDFTYDIVLLAVKLCYHRSLVPSLSTTKAISLLKFASIYDITALKDNLELYLGDKLTVSHVCEMVTVAKEETALKLQQKCMDFLVSCVSKKHFIPNIGQIDKEFINDLFKIFLCNESKTNFCSKY